MALFFSFSVYVSVVSIVSFGSAFSVFVFVSVASFGSVFSVCVFVVSFLGFSGFVCVTVFVVSFCSVFFSLFLFVFLLFLFSFVFCLCFFCSVFFYLCFYLCFFWFCFFPAFFQLDSGCDLCSLFNSWSMQNFELKTFFIKKIYFCIFIAMNVTHLTPFLNSIMPCPVKK